MTLLSTTTEMQLRKKFEEFYGRVHYDNPKTVFLRKKPNKEYLNTDIEDAWQWFWRGALECAAINTYPES